MSSTPLCGPQGLSLACLLYLALAMMALFRLCLTYVSKEALFEYSAARPAYGHMAD